VDFGPRDLDRDTEHVAVAEGVDADAVGAAQSSATGDVFSWQKVSLLQQPRQL
jgi:hypothetical protein